MQDTNWDKTDANLIVDKGLDFKYVKNITAC